MPILHQPLRTCLACAAALLVTLAQAQSADPQLTAAMVEQRWGDALLQIDAALKKKPNDTQMQMNRGVVLSNLNRTAEALAVFKKVATENPDLPAPHNNMAVILASRGNYEEAKVELERAIRTHPAYATAYENMGDLYSHMAGDAYRKALQLDKNQKTARPKLEMVNELNAMAARPGEPTRSTTSKPTQLALTPAAAPAAAVIAPPVAVLSPTPAPAPAPTKAALPTPAPTAPVAAPMPAPVAPPPKPAVVATPVAAAATVPTPSKPAAAPTPAPAVQTPGPESASKAEVEAAVRNWAHAWSRRDMRAYEATYAPDFKGKASSHAAWLSERRDRIATKTHIDVKVSHLDIQVSDDQAEVQLRQTYTSDALTSQSRKTMRLQKVDGKWLIRQELTGR